MSSTDRWQTGRSVLDIEDIAPTACITLDLENDWNFDEPGYDHLTLEYLGDFIDLIDELDVPVTVFAVGRTIERHPEAVDAIRRHVDSEFHLHSYYHDLRGGTDLRTEVELGKEVFTSHFGTEPIGYRAPQGRIEPGHFEILEEAGFEFDSSLIPSYRPGVYNNIRAPLAPHYPPSTSDLLEIPLAVVPQLRLPIAQNYLKLFGRPYMWYLQRTRLPPLLVFNVHLQDLYRTASHDKLEQPRRFLFGRNLHRSIDLFTEFVELVKNRGYEFAKMTDVYQHVRGTSRIARVQNDD